MILLFNTLSFLGLIMSGYVTFCCFAIIHRFNPEDSRILAVIISAGAAMGIVGIIEFSSEISGNQNTSVLLLLIISLISVILSNNPRVKVGDKREFN